MFQGIKNSSLGHLLTIQSFKEYVGVYVSFFNPVEYTTTPPSICSAHFTFSPIATIKMGFCPLKDDYVLILTPSFSDVSYSTSPLGTLRFFRL